MRPAYDAELSVAASPSRAGATPWARPSTLSSRSWSPATGASRRDGPPCRTLRGSTWPRTGRGHGGPWAGPAPSTPAGQIPEFHDVVHTILTWSIEVLAFHDKAVRRISNGRLDGTYNKFFGPAPGSSPLHQQGQLRSPKHPGLPRCDTTRTTEFSGRHPTNSASLCFLSQRGNSSLGNPRQEGGNRNGATRLRRGAPKPRRVRCIGLHYPDEAGPK